MSEFPVEATIRRRTSWRSYDGQTLSDKDRESVENYLSSDLGTPFGNQPVFRLIDYLPNEGKLGTYGFIDGAKHFIVGSTNDDPMSLEDYGYSLEKIILYVTNMGLGSCWLGGTFNKSGFAKAFKLTENESIPAVTPIGYKKKQRRTIGKIIRWGAGSRNRKSWDQLFFKPDWTPLSKIDAGVYSNALEMIRIGPSASNGQPWRVVVDDDSVHFYLKSKSGYKSMNRLDMGIAFCHFELTLNESNVEGNWSVADQITSSDDLEYVATWKKR